MILILPVSFYILSVQISKSHFRIENSNDEHCTNDIQNEENRMRNFYYEVGI